MYDGAYKTDLKTALSEFGLRANKKLGQNFLCDKNMADAIVSASGDLSEMNVLEIGPGAGALTGRLCAAARSVCAIELDGGLYRLLSSRLNAPNLTLINADALQYDFAQLPAQPDCVVANLPYYITTALINRLLQLPTVRTLSLMMQREVADRLTARPGSKAYGSLSVAVQYHCETRVALSIPPECFYPAPDVASSLVHFTRRPYASRPADEQHMFTLVRTCFAMRRKTISNNMSASGKWDKPHIERALAAARIDPRARAEALSIDDFIRLSDAIVKGGQAIL